MEKLIVVGKITGAFGIKGWVKIHSHTDPEEALFAYPSLKLLLNGQLMPITVDVFQAHGKGYVAKFHEVIDRNQAEAFKGGLIQVARDDFEALVDGEYYWDDLAGLSVINQAGVTLGRVDHLFNAGASDVMVVKGVEGQGKKEYLIPFLTEQFIIEVDLSQGKIIVDWDESF